LASVSASKLWPRPRGFGLGLASISLSYYVIGHFPCKNRVKFGNFVTFPAIILNQMLLIIIWYFFHNYFWPRPHSPGLGLVALASASASRFWPRLTSLIARACSFGICWNKKHNRFTNSSHTMAMFCQRVQFLY